MTELPPVTLCIINYNGAEHLRHAFQALRAQEWVFAELLVVDNASDDASLEVVRELYPEARVVELARNFGPGRARNVGFRSATNDLILFQDNDIRLCPDTARVLVEHLHNSAQVLLVAPRVVYANDPGTIQYDSADCHFLGLMAPRNANARVSELDSRSCETTSMISACFLIDRAQWHGDELFDESLGFNLEDHDLGVRARVRGHSLRVEPRALVLHGSGTPGLSWRPGEAPGEQRLYFLTLNRWIVVTKCFAGRTGIILLPALLLYELIQLGWYLGNGKLRVWWRAVRAYRRTHRRIRTARRVIQCQRRTNDAHILRDGPLPLTAAVRSGKVTMFLIAVADSAMRGYWRLARRWV